MKRKAVGAVGAQSVQALVSLVLQIIVVRLLGVAEYGRFAILYGALVLVTAVLTGLVGDSLVALDRSRRSVRAGLEVVLLGSVVSLSVVGSIVVLASGFGSALEAVTFGLVLLFFGSEEIVRRLLMAHMQFGRVMAADLSSFVLVMVGVLVAAMTVSLTLEMVLGFIAIGQLLASVVGWSLVPRTDRYLVRPVRSEWREVWGYGRWRGLQQVLRPGLFTVVRVLVLTVAGVGAVGILEAARTYASPLTLVVGGLSSFLFVHFAGHRAAGSSRSVRDADKIVAVLILVTVAMSAIALVLAPWASPLAFGLHVDLPAISAWLAYGVSVAFVTPYGALGAVTDHQVGVFLIRLGDTVLAVGIAAALLLLGCPASAVPIGLAIASAAGGLALRALVARVEGQADGSASSRSS